MKNKAASADESNSEILLKHEKARDFSTTRIDGALFTIMPDRASISLTMYTDSIRVISEPLVKDGDQYHAGIPNVEHIREDKIELILSLNAAKTIATTLTRFLNEQAKNSE